MLPMGPFLLEPCLPKMIDRYCKLQLFRPVSTVWACMSFAVSPQGADTSHQEATGEMPVKDDRQVLQTAADFWFVLADFP